MKLLRRIRYRIQSRRADSELAEEIEFHRALKQEEFERSGLSPKDAAATSRRELGNTLRAREESRDVWGWSWLHDAARDVVYACRTLRKMPVLAVVVIASLGIGIGVNTAVFSWIQAVVLQPVPGVENSSAFYLIEPRAETGSYPGSSWPEYNDLRQRLTSFQNIIAFRMAPFNVGEADRIERKYGLLVSDNYFSGLGLKPALGHFPEGDEASERKPIVVLSHGFWKAKFNADAKALGETIRVNDQVLTIIAVAPEDFQGTVLALDFDLWIPSTLAPALFPGSRELDDRGERGYALIGNLGTGATRVQAQTELDAAMRQLSQSYPAVSGKFEAELLPYWSAPRGPQRFIVSSLAILQAVTMVLLMAVCGNTANLLLARAAARGREIGTRLAIGATRWRVIRLLMTESLLLGLLGAALGVVIAIWGTQALRAVPLPTFFPIRFQTRVDLMGLAVSVFLGMSCALAFGLAPALQLVRRDPQTQLRSNFSTASRKRLPRALMAIEAALALMVLLAAGLFFESFRDTKTVDPGFQIEGVLLAAYDLTSGGAGHLQMNRTIDPALSRDFADRVLKRLRELPDVESAAIAAFVPLDIHGLPMRSFDVTGRARTDGSPDRALINFVTPDYFRTMRIPQLAGVDFTALDDRTTVPQIIVNQEFIRRYVPGLEPTGRRLQYGKDNFVIAGVVKDSFYDSFGEAPIPIMYFSYRDRPRPSGEIHLKTRAGAETLVAGEVQRVVREIEPGIPIFNVRTLADHVETNSFFRRIPARLFTVLGPLLLLFAAIGIYSVVDNNVAHRITEIGVRLAVGATPRDVVAQVVGETLKVIGVGILAGVLVAVIVYVHVVPGGPIDPRVFLGIPAVLLLVAATACWLPARRTASVDPMIALRQE
jgi:putative ABC transport system permease protein